MDLDCPDKNSGNPNVNAYGDATVFVWDGKYFYPTTEERGRGQEAGPGCEKGLLIEYFAVCTVQFADKKNTRN